MSKVVHTRTPVEPAEVLQREAGTAPEQRTLLHPAAGGLILGLDWLFFSGAAATGMAAAPVSMVAGFTLGTIGTTIIQRKLGGDSRRRALAKGLMAGIVVGFPLPIAGTAVGGGILALSGLDRLLKRKHDRTTAK